MSDFLTIRVICFYHFDFSAKSFTDTAFLNYYGIVELACFRKPTVKNGFD